MMYKCMYVSFSLCNINESIDVTNRATIIHEWATDNGLALNPFKSSCLVIYKKYIITDGLNKIKKEYEVNFKNQYFIFNYTLA